MSLQGNYFPALSVLTSAINSFIKAVTSFQKKIPRSHRWAHSNDHDPKTLQWEGTRQRLQNESVDIYIAFRFWGRQKVQWNSNRRSSREIRERLQVAKEKWKWFSNASNLQLMINANALNCIVLCLRSEIVSLTWILCETSLRLETPNELERDRSERSKVFPSRKKLHEAVFANRKGFIISSLIILK